MVTDYSIVPSPHTRAHANMQIHIHFCTHMHTRTNMYTDAGTGVYSALFLVYNTAE